MKRWEGTWGWARVRVGSGHAPSLQLRVGADASQAMVGAYSCPLMALALLVHTWGAGLGGTWGGRGMGARGVGGLLAGHGTGAYRYTRAVTRTRRAPRLAVLLIISSPKHVLCPS